MPERVSLSDGSLGQGGAADDPTGPSSVTPFGPKRDSGSSGDRSSGKSDSRSSGKSDSRSSGKGDSSGDTGKSSSGTVGDSESWPPEELRTGIDIASPDAAPTPSATTTTEQGGASVTLSDMKYFIPPTLTLYQMWGPTFTILFFLGILVFVLMWLYVYVNFNSYQDRITVLSLGNLFNQNPQAAFEKYIQQSTQESIAAAMQDITTSSNNVKTNVARIQSQSDANSTLYQNLQNILSNFYMPDSTTVKSVKSPAPAPVPAPAPKS